MVPTTKTFWLEHVRKWKASGLSSKDYAEQAGLNFRTLTWYASKLKSEIDGASDPNGNDSTLPGFIEVLPAPQSTAAELIELRLRNISIRLPSNFDERTLERVLDILEARS